MAGQNGIQDSKCCASIDKDEITTDDYCVTKPLTFKRVPQQVSVKRFNFLCSDHQIVRDAQRNVILCLLLGDCTCLIISFVVRCIKNINPKPCVHGFQPHARRTLVSS